MTHWKKLVLKKALIARLPFADTLRMIKRRLFGYPPNRDNVELTLRQYDRMKRVLEKHGGHVRGTTFLEIGSGWFPIIPILLARDGAERIIMSDLHPHMDRVTFLETADYLKKRFPDDGFIQTLGDFASLPITYSAPFKVGDLPDGSVDCVLSRTVLEHIPKSALYTLFSALRKKIVDGGLMVHTVDHSDHLEHFDKSISKVNFLTWSEEKHALINFLTQSGENRLRHHEYEPIFRDSDYELIEEITEIDHRTLEAIKTLHLTYPFSRMRPEQIAVLTSIYVLKPA